MSHSIYRTRIINLIKKQQGTLGKRETECFDLTSIGQTILKDSHLHKISRKSREKEKEIDLRKTDQINRTPKKKKIKMRGFSRGYLARGKRCQEQRRRAVQEEIFQWKSCSALGSRPLRDSLQRARLMAQERRYSRRRLRPLSRSGLQVRRTRLVGTKAWATFGQRPNPYRDVDLSLSR